MKTTYAKANPETLALSASEARDIYVEARAGAGLWISPEDMILGLNRAITTVDGIISRMVESAKEGEPVNAATKIAVNRDESPAEIIQRQTVTILRQSERIEQLVQMLESARRDLRQITERAAEYQAEVADLKRRLSRIRTRRWSDDPAPRPETESGTVPGLVVRKPHCLAQPGPGEAERAGVERADMATNSQIAALRAEIERHTQEFLARGGKIQVIPAYWEKSPETDKDPEPKAKRKHEAARDPSWINTAEAAEIIGISGGYLLLLKATGAEVPKYRKPSSKRLEWYRPSVEEYAAEYKRRRSKAA